MKRVKKGCDMKYPFNPFPNKRPCILRRQLHGHLLSQYGCQLGYEVAQICLTSSW